MIDWTTVIVPFPHQREISGGLLLDTDQHGEIKWQVVKSLSVNSPLDCGVLVKSQDSASGRRSHLYISGNPAKFLYGHNVDGTDDVRFLVAEMTRGLLVQLGETVSDQQYSLWRNGGFTLKKVDINYMRHCGSRAAARQMLYIISHTSKMRYSGRGEFTGDTLYFAKHSRRRAIKIYCKGDEIEKGGRSRRIPDGLTRSKEELLSIADDAVRIELVLRSLELKELSLQDGRKWNGRTASELFERYMGKIEFSPNLQLSSAKLIRLPRHLQATYGLWTAGLNLRSVMKPSSFHRHRRLLKSYGVDIGVLPVSRKHLA